MKIDVTLVDVNDGDAIIIELDRDGQSLVMVVDGGKKIFYETKVKPALDKILLKHKKIAPDIVVCTHYDSDHIGGLIPLLKDYVDDVKQVWVHKTPVLLNKYLEQSRPLLEEYRKDLFLPTIDMHLLIKEVLGYSVKSYHKTPEQRRQIGLLLESIDELKQFIDLIPKDKLIEPFNNGKSLLPDWPEIKILGPTIEYYSELFPTSKTLSNFLQEQMTQQLYVENRDLLKSINKHIGTKSPTGSACEKLKNDNDTSLTATNKASIIFVIEDGDNKYLFTGDAGIDSFKKIPDYEQRLKNLYFLKVPHHGSSNNLTKRLIELMHPSFAYNSGNKYQDDEVLDCLKSKGAKVHTTRTEGNLTFSSMNPS